MKGNPFKKAYVEKDTKTSLDDFNRTSIEMSDGVCLPPSCNDLDIVYGDVAVTIRGSYSCPLNEIDRARSNVKKYLAREFYSDIENMVMELKNRVFDGNRDSCLEMINTIIDYTRDINE